jgi:hypothetical protein
LEKLDEGMERVKVYIDRLGSDAAFVDSFDDLAADQGRRDADPELVGAVAAALGEEFVIELDI